MKVWEFRVFFESGRKSINLEQVYCISGLSDMVFDFGTVPENCGWLESLLNEVSPSRKVGLLQSIF